MIDTVTLDRFELLGPLGGGADYDVRAAFDRETERPVVLKRPSPQAARRQMHGPIEERTDRILAAYEAAGQRCPTDPDLPENHTRQDVDAYNATMQARSAALDAGELPAGVPRIIGITDAGIHDAYFGDDVGQPYRVRVEERAYGIPLVGDPRSRILRVPIGLPQNLFALHPVWWQVLSEFEDKWPIQEQLLAAQEIFAAAGYVLLDVGPHNVFYSPGWTRQITLVDTGALVGHGVERAYGNAPQDVHDFYLELLKYYITPEPPPREAAGYYDPYNQRPVISLEQECDDLTAAFTAAGGALGDAMAACIARVRRRDYGSIAQFRQDLQECLRLITIRNEQLYEAEVPENDFFEIKQPTPARAWLDAMERLAEPHWRERYLFDADNEIDMVYGIP